jgi:hypothetical protein
MQIAEFAELLAGGVTISQQDDTLFRQDFMGTKQPLVPVAHNLFRRPSDPEATRVFTESPQGDFVYASAGTYYERVGLWKPYLHRFLVFGTIIVMFSSIVYSLFWIPAYIYKTLKRRHIRPAYIPMRLIPLLAVLSLIFGVVMVSDQTILELGVFTARNAIFFGSTWLFAGLSALSLFTAYRSFRKPVKTTARVYAVLLSSACFGITVYFAYWGVIGLRLWAY